MHRAFLAFALISTLALPFVEGKPKSASKGNTIENFLRPSRVTTLSMSPDGKYAAGTAPMGEIGNSGLIVFDLDTMKVIRSIAPNGRSIRRVRWTTNEDIAYQLIKWNKYTDGFYSINVNRKSTCRLISNDTLAHFVDAATDEDYAWVWLRDGERDGNEEGSLAKLKVKGNAQDRIPGGGTFTIPTARNPLIYNRIPHPPGQIYWWYTDQDHEPRIVSRFHNDERQYIHRYNEEEKWTKLDLDAENWDIEIFGKDKNIVYVSGFHDQQTKGLYPYNISTGEIGELLFRDDYYDFSDSVSYLTHDDGVVGFRYWRDMPVFVWLDPGMEKIQKMIDGAIPGKVNIVYHSSDDFTRHLIFSYSDNDPGSYALLDLKEKRLEEITKTAPWLDLEKLPRTQAFHFKTSDGLKLEGYLTRPNDIEGPYPTICLVHGGPWSRDYGGYNDETQYLVSQGYAVLRVNFRGSTGYGKTISSEYDYDFRKMHDDITDAVKMAVKHGIADPDRVAIMGASFGGYAAICGAAFEPDLYRCAITNMGVFDWETMIKARKQQDHRYSYHKLMEELGDPKENQAKFEEISPIYHVEKIKSPVFVIHGKDDSNVSIKQSKKLQSELKKHGVEHETYFVPWEGHNIFDLKKRVKTYQMITDFLDKHMK